jgi:hypothetical protein
MLSIHCSISMLLVVLQLLLLSQENHSFTPVFSVQRRSVFFLNYRIQEDDDIPVEAARAKPVKTSKHDNKKPTIVNLKTLDDLKYFLEEDDRLVAIK